MAAFRRAWTRFCRSMDSNFISISSCIWNRLFECCWCQFCIRRSWCPHFFSRSALLPSAPQTHQVRRVRPVLSWCWLVYWFRRLFKVFPVKHSWGNLVHVRKTMVCRQVPSQSMSSLPCRTAPCTQSIPMRSHWFCRQFCTRDTVVHRFWRTCWTATQSNTRLFSCPGISCWRLAGSQQCSCRCTSTYTFGRSWSHCWHAPILVVKQVQVVPTTWHCPWFDST